MVDSVRKLFAVMALGAAALAAMPLGCGSGLSTEDATLRCDQEKVGKSACVTQAAYDACIQCYEECGDECTAAAACPETYSCPE